MTKQAILWLLLGAAVALGINMVRGSLPLVGEYRELSSGDGPIVPPSAMEGDPPFIEINAAQFEFSLKQALFVDAREPEEFACGTIPGSRNLPFESLPEGDLTAHFDSMLFAAPKDSSIIVFCSGEECEASLHLARNLQDKGYSKLSVFFGGYREWEKFQLPIEKKQECQ